MFLNYLFGKEKSFDVFNEKFPQKLLSNPSNVLRRLNCFKDNAIEDIMKWNSNLNDLIDIFQHHIDKCFLLFIDECISKWCTLNRFRNPRYRSYYEQVCLNFMRENCGKVLCFGSAGLFPELIIFSKYLRKFPKADVEIDIVDENLKPSYEVRENIFPGMTRACFDSIEELRSFVNNYSYEIWSYEPDHGDQKNFLRTLLLNELRLVSFKQYLSYQFPYANVKLNIFQNCTDYLNCVSSVRFPDIILASDIDYEDDFCRATGAVKDFRKLAKTVKIEKPYSQNLRFGTIPKGRYVLESVEFEEDDLICYQETEVYEYIDFTDKIFKKILWFIAGIFGQFNLIYLLKYWR